jgi:hypothetical protein
MASRVAVDPGPLGLRDVKPAEEFIRLRIGERGQSELLKEIRPPRGFMPGSQRWFPTNQQQPNRVRERGDKDLAEPGVEETQELVIVDGDDDLGAKQAESLSGSRSVLGRSTDGGGQRIEKSSLGRFDPAAIEADNRRATFPRLAEEDIQERGLPHSADALEPEDDRPALFQQRPEGVQFRLATQRVSLALRAA